MANFCNNPLCAWALINNKRQWRNFTFSYYKFNHVKFWASLNQVKRWNCTFKPSNQLIFEKSINLNDSKTNRAVLYIGLNPEDRFRIYARLEKHSISDCFMLTLAELTSLLNFLVEKKSEIFGDDKPIGGADIGDKYEIFGSESNGDAEILCYENGHRMTIDKKSMQKIISVEPYINRFIVLFEKKIATCERLFIQLLNNFCLGKSFSEVHNSTCYDAKYDFFNSIVNLKCNCTNESFTTEIALKCDYWFVVCAPWFLKTMMLTESERLLTFKNTYTWPHDEYYVSVKEMAKCGMYYTGIEDNVKCAFCDVLLHKWERGDKPIIEHFKYNPKCPFLYNFRNTQNVSDVGEIEEIDKLIALLPSERGTDEVDHN